MICHQSTNWPRNCSRTALPSNINSFKNPLRSITPIPQPSITGLNKSSSHNFRWITIVEIHIRTIKVYCNLLIINACRLIRYSRIICLWCRIINKVAIFIRKEIRHIKRARMLFKLINLKCSRARSKAIKNHKTSINSIE